MIESDSETGTEYDNYIGEDYGDPLQNGETNGD